MTTTQYEPEKTVEHVPGSSPTRNVTIGETMTATCLVYASTATYGNGVALAAANHGDSNTEEGTIEQIEIPHIHPRGDGTPWDKTTSYSAGDYANAIEHKVGNAYWLKGSAVTATARKTKLIVAGSGLVKAQLAHTATPLPVHMWTCHRSVSAGTYILGGYDGIVSTYTAA
jgi:hypothetical protein